MPAEGVTYYAMTRLEQLLKRCFLQRPGIAESPLQPRELSEYISWLVENFAHDPGYQLTPEDLPHFSTGQLEKLGTHLLRDPSDRGVLDVLSAGYGHQQEDRYILSGSHISAGRMMRYMPAHWHRDDYFNVYYAVSGECPVWLSNEIIALKPGGVLIVAPDVLHATPCYGDDRVLVYLMIRSNTFDQIFWNQIPPENLMFAFFRRALSGEQQDAYLRFETGDDAEIRDLVYRICLQFQQAGPYASQLMNAMMTTFFLLLLQRYEGTVRLPRSRDFYWKHEFSAILTYIQTHYSSVKIKELAEMFHYSERQVTRIVQQCTGENFGSLVTRLRMERAGVLLQTPEISIEKISREVGYATLSSFYRSFIGFYGCTPARFRRDRTQGPSGA